MVLKYDGLQKHLGIARPLLLNWGQLLGESTLQWSKVVVTNITL
jgi:hypothetical protein